MIGSVALLCALATASSAPPRVHAPRFEMREFAVKVPDFDFAFPAIDPHDLETPGFEWPGFDARSLRDFTRFRFDLGEIMPAKITDG